MRGEPRRLRRPPSPSARQAPRAGVHDGPQQIAEHRLWRVALLREEQLGAEERRHRRDQHPHALLVVGIGRHRPPGGEPPLVTPGQSREHPAARHELERELARLGQEPQRVAERQARTRRRRQRQQHLERRLRAERDRRNHPRVKQLRLARTAIPVRPAEAAASAAARLRTTAGAGRAAAPPPAHRLRARRPEQRARRPPPPPSRRTDAPAAAASPDGARDASEPAPAESESSPHTHSCESRDHTAWRAITPTSSRRGRTHRRRRSRLPT